MRTYIDAEGPVLILECSPDKKDIRDILNEEDKEKAKTNLHRVLTLAFQRGLVKGMHLVIKEK